MWINKKFNAQNKIVMDINFGKILSEIMKERGFTQLSLSILLGVRQSQVSNWVNNKSLPGYYSIALLCDKLGLKPNDLFK